MIEVPNQSMFLPEARQIPLMVRTEVPVRSMAVMKSTFKGELVANEVEE
jgi:hypothetical protein